MSSVALSPRPDDAVGRRERRLARERAARREAEAISERVTRELYSALGQLRRAHQLTELLGEIAVAANQADSEERVLRVAVERICHHMGWPVGHAYALTAAGELVSTGIWHLDEVRTFDEFRSASTGLEFADGMGLPRRVLMSGAPAAIEDLAVDVNFRRQAAAEAVGLRSAFAFPVLVRSDVHAVLEFFSRQREPIDSAVLRVMGQIGAQLGRVSERRLTEDRLTQLAMHDTLTGLGNRALLLDHIHRALDQSRRTAAPVSVLFLDVDDFKGINDSLGHDVGDAVLCEIARRLQETLRASDKVARGWVSTVARFGGDEFAVLLDGCADPEVVAGRIMNAMHAPLLLGGQEIFISASAGGTVADPAADGADALRAANVAMHVAKQTGKRRYQRFEPAMHDEAIRRQRVTAELRLAIGAGQLRLDYQPEIDVSSGEAIAVEALVRWQHPELGLVPPMDFISIAEDTGLIVELGLWVLENACRQAVAWGAAHPQLAGLTMAVNVSGRQLRDAGFPGLVADVLRRTGLRADRLCLEITETVLIENMAVVEQIVDAVRALGVRFAIDDFGTGYSSLATLNRLPVDVLKIDRSFVANVPYDDAASSIVGTITSLGHRLGMRVIAEGIETDAQLQGLERLGCDIVQGFHLARPAPANDVLSLLLSRPTRSASAALTAQAVRPTPVGLTVPGDGRQARR